MAIDFIPTNDPGKANFLDNLALKIGGYAVLLGLTPAEVASVQADATMFNYILDMQEAYKTFKQNLTKYKDMLRDGAPDFVGPFPVSPVLAAPPPLVTKNIFRRTRELVARIKAASAYNEAIGEDLGIVGDDQVDYIPSLKPLLKSRLDAGRPLIIWTKGSADALDIYVDRMDGAGFVFLATDTKPDYLDTVAFPAGVNSVVYDYKAIYRIGDEQTGQFSDPIRVTVTKQLGT